MLAAAFAVDWSATGGASFIELVTGVNLAFVAWDRFQERLKFVDRDCRDVVARACANIIDEQHRANSESHFTQMLSDVEGAYRGLWRGCFAFGLLAVVSGFVMLFFNWSCRHDYLLLLPLATYLMVSGVVWVYFWNKCRNHCNALKIAQGKPIRQTDDEAVSALTKVVETKLKKPEAKAPEQQHNSQVAPNSIAAKKAGRRRK